MPHHVTVSLFFIQPIAKRVRTLTKETNQKRFTKSMQNSGDREHEFVRNRRNLQNTVLEVF